MHTLPDDEDQQLRLLVVVDVEGTHTADTPVSRDALRCWGTSLYKFILKTVARAFSRVLSQFSRWMGGWTDDDVVDETQTNANIDSADTTNNGPERVEIFLAPWIFSEDFPKSADFIEPETRRFYFHLGRFSASPPLQQFPWKEQSSWLVGVIFIDGVLVGGSSN